MRLRQRIARRSVDPYPGGVRVDGEEGGGMVKRVLHWKEG